MGSVTYELVGIRLGDGSGFSTPTSSAGDSPHGDSPRSYYSFQKRMQLLMESVRYCRNSPEIGMSIHFSESPLCEVSWKSVKLLWR
jgi:hypothetical protein